MSIIPGIEIAAPERTDTSSGSSESPKRLPVFSSSAREMLLDLGLEAVGHRLAVLHVRARGVGRDREARRDRHSELRHLREPDALAPQELASALGRLVEVVDKALGHRREYSHSHTETHDAAPDPSLKGRLRS